MSEGGIFGTISLLNFQPLYSAISSPLFMANGNLFLTFFKSDKSSNAISFQVPLKVLATIPDFFKLTDIFSAEGDLLILKEEKESYKISKYWFFLLKLFDISSKLENISL